MMGGRKREEVMAMMIMAGLSMVESVEYSMFLIHIAF
jgi:hypothetical protein